ncbi:MAG: MFS transporter [Anaerolineales bacterium]|nr:MFS transporter [Anaerolineales bacterium]
MATQFSIHDGRRWKSAFFTIWGGQATSLLGSMLVQFALIWHLTVETGSATVLATASLVGLLPYVIFGPIIGTLVDRWNRRVIMIVADTVIATATVGLAMLFALGQVEIWHIYVLMFVRSVGGGFHHPAMAASTSLMVPKEHLTRVQGVNQMLSGGLNIVAAPLGAILIGLLPMAGILAIDVFTALVAVAPLLFFEVPQPSRKQDLTAAASTFRQDLVGGFRYMLNWPGMLMIALMAVMINFMLTPAFSFIPLLVKDHLAGEALQLGWVNSALGIGIVVGGFLLGVWGGFKRRILTAMLGLTGIGLGALLMSQVPPGALYLAVIAAFVLGMMNPITNGPIFAIVQTTVEPDMQGRVMTLLSSVAGGMSPISLLIAGPLADHFGIQTWFLLGGVVCLLMAIAGLFIPAVMQIEAGRHPEAVQAQLAVEPGLSD